MKIGLVGDTHGSAEALKKIEQVFTGVNLLFHTGDHWQDGVYLEKKMGLPVLAVKGNCDYGSQPSELQLKLKDKQFFLTHGHTYGVKFTIKTLLARAKELGGDYCLFGHTHRPFLKKEAGIYFLNPGSWAFPRGKEKYIGIGLLYRENEFQPFFVQG